MVAKNGEYKEKIKKWGNDRGEKAKKKKKRIGMYTVKGGRKWQLNKLKQFQYRHRKVPKLKTKQQRKEQIN